MPRPLKVLTGIIAEDQQATCYKIGKLLGDAIASSEKTINLFTACLQDLLNIDRASKADRSIVNLGVRFCNDIKASNLLFGSGLLLNSMMMMRDAIEILVVAEYLHDYPNETQSWQNAETFEERRRFGINVIKDKVKGGSEWKDLFDWLSSFIHPNESAKPVYSRNRSIFGHNLYVGGFYDPGQTTALFLMEFAICLNFLDSLTSWYRSSLPTIVNRRKELKELEKVYRSHKRKLIRQGKLEQQKIEKEIEKTRLSKEEIISLFQFLDSLD